MRCHPAPRRPGPAAGQTASSTAASAAKPDTPQRPPSAAGLARRRRAPALGAERGRDLVGHCLHELGPPEFTPWNSGHLFLLLNSSGSLRRAASLSWSSF